MANLAGAALVHLGPAGLEHEVARVHDAWLGLRLRIKVKVKVRARARARARVRVQVKFKVRVRVTVVARDVRRVGGRLGRTLRADAGGGVVNEVLVRVRVRV